MKRFWSTLPTGLSFSGTMLGLISRCRLEGRALTRARLANFPAESAERADQLIGQ